jgi:hypothetical protein
MRPRVTRAHRFDDHTGESLVQRRKGEHVAGGKQVGNIVAVAEGPDAVAIRQATVPTLDCCRLIPGAPDQQQLGVGTALGDNVEGAHQVHVALL